MTFSDVSERRQIEEERRRIWANVWPAATPLADDIDLDAIAATHRLSGGQITNVAVAAAYEAATDGGQLTDAHLRHALRREHAKLGRDVRLPREAEVAA